MIHRYRHLLPYLALVGAWALFFWRFAAPSPSDRVIYPAGDFTQQFGVFRDVAYRAAIAGRFPLWADCLYSGYPFHADPQAQVFYPPMWLTFGILRLQGWGNFPVDALVAEVAVHYLATSIFLYLFLRSLSLRRPAATLGALVFTYGGYLTGSPPLQTATLNVVTWLPLALLFAGRLAETRRLRHLALVALMLALAYLAGHPQTFVYVALLTVAYFAFRARAAQWGLGAFVRHAAALTLLTSALSAVQLLPSVHFILNSTRASVTFEQAGHGFPFADVLQFFLTGFVSHWHPLYVGLLPLGLAAFALSRPTSQLHFWAGAALAGLILSFGSKGVAYDVAYWVIPGYRLFRGQEHLSLVVSFSLAVLAAFGAHHLFGPLSRLARSWLNRLMRLVRTLFLVTIVLLALLTYLARLGVDPSDWRQISDRAGVLTFGIGLALLAFVLRAHVPAMRRWVPTIYVSVVILDLFAADRPLNVVPYFEPYPYDPVLDAIYAEPDFFRVQDDARLPGHAGCAYGYRAVEGVTPYQVATYTRFLEDAPELVRWQLLGVKYVVTWREQLFTSGGQLIPSEVVARGAVPDAKGNVTKTQRLNLEPRRAFIIHRVEVVPDDTALYNHLADPAFDPFSTVILPQAVDVGTGGGHDSVTVAFDQSGRLRLRPTSDSNAILVVSEAYFPGWRVTVDGQPTQVLRADGALLAVRVPSGAHTVEFVYRSPWLGWGGMISALALLFTGVMLAGVRSRSRQREIG